MVRTLDPEQSDVSSILKRYLYLLNPLRRQTPRVEPTQQRIIVGMLMQQEFFQKTIQELARFTSKPLKVNFDPNCKDSIRYLGSFRNLAQFPASGDPVSQTLTICSNLITSEHELKQNFAREIILMRYGHVDFYKYGKYLSTERQSE